ncbi:MAG: hypothetical protein JWQ85_4089 [Mucilaginibacter sp.]|jgi:hypothetical protein|nr:hypothetical protein [Mucilaginibacter sp.]
MNNSKATYILYVFISLYIITAITVLVGSSQGVDWDPGTCGFKQERLSKLESLS